MGAYMSRGRCEIDYGITLDCEITFYDNHTVNSVGGVTRGSFEGNPDIAGIGILNVFFAVSAFALGLSTLYLALQLMSWMIYTGLKPVTRLMEEGFRNSVSNMLQDYDDWKWRMSVGVADIVENLILSCSDQQLFTGSAYALVLVLEQGCKVSAYHYNIIGNMLLITCSTHLVSVCVVSQYWKSPILSGLRIILITCLYGVTGIILSNTNVASGLKYPSQKPAWNDTNSTVVLPAVCFQSDKLLFPETVSQSVSSQSALRKAILQSTANNFIFGWNFFLLMMVWYVMAILAEMFRGLHRLWENRKRKRQSALANADPNEPHPPTVQMRRMSFRRQDGRHICYIQEIWFHRVFWVYQVSGVAFSWVSICYAYKYILYMRRWIGHSGWIQLDQNGKNPESDISTFGQLVPAFLTLLIVFTFLQLIGDKFIGHRNAHRHNRLLPGPQDGTGNPPGQQGSGSPTSPDKKDDVFVQVSSPQVHPTNAAQPQSLSPNPVPSPPPAAHPGQSASHPPNTPGTPNEPAAATLGSPQNGHTLVPTGPP